MTVLAKGKPGATLLRRHRGGRRGRSVEPGEARPGTEQPAAQRTVAEARAQERPVVARATTTEDMTDGAGAVDGPGMVDGSGSTPAGRRDREASAPQDQAMYTCACGFVFRAPVSTSVGCPHCGSAQAW